MAHVAQNAGFFYRAFRKATISRNLTLRTDESGMDLGRCRWRAGHHIRPGTKLNAKLAGAH
jgi:hypothetical protein